MTFVPTTAYVPTPTPPSPRTRELAERVDSLIQEFRTERPQLTDQEIRAALQLVQQRSAVPLGGARIAVLAGAAALAAGVAVFGFFLAQSEAGIDLPPGGMLTIVAVLTFMGAVIAFVKFMRSGGP